MAKESRAIKAVGDRIQAASNDPKKAASNDRKRSVSNDPKKAASNDWKRSARPVHFITTRYQSNIFNVESYAPPLPNLQIAPIPEKILNHTIDVIGSYDAAMRWLMTPSLALGSIPPIYLIITEEGSKQVQNELIRIEAGVL